MLNTPFSDFPRQGTNFKDSSSNLVNYHMRVLRRLYSMTIATDVTSQDVKGSLKLGNKVLIQNGLEATVTPRQVNGARVWSNVTRTAVGFSIDHIFTANHKIDNVDFDFESMDPFPELGDDANEKFKQIVDQKVINAMVMDSGRTLTVGDLPAGTWKDENLLKLLSAIKIHGIEGIASTEMFLIIHPFMSPYILNNPAFYADASGMMEGAAIRGYVKSIANGVRIYESKYIPGQGTADDPYLCVLGVKQATACVFKTDPVQYFEKLENWHGKGVSWDYTLGYKVLQPDRLLTFPIVTR